MTGHDLSCCCFKEIMYFARHFCKDNVCGSSSADRALAFQAKGRGFESRLPLIL